MSSANRIGGALASRPGMATGRGATASGRQDTALTALASPRPYASICALDAQPFQAQESAMKRKLRARLPGRMRHQKANRGLLEVARRDRPLGCRTGNRLEPEDPTPNGSQFFRLWAAAIPQRGKHRPWRVKLLKDREQPGLIRLARHDQIRTRDPFGRRQRRRLRVASISIVAVARDAMALQHGANGCPGIARHPRRASRDRTGLLRRQARCHGCQHREQDCQKCRSHRENVHACHGVRCA